MFKVSTLGLRIKSIAAERNSPDLFNYIKRGNTKRIFSNLILVSSSRIAVQFESYRFKYPFWLRSRIVHTPNWVAQLAEIEIQRNKEVFQIVFVGRLTFQKNVSIKTTNTYHCLKKTILTSLR